VIGLEKLVVIAVDPDQARRGAKLTVDLGTTTLSEKVDAVAGDPGCAMSEEEVVGKFIRYAESTLGPQGVAAVVAFILHGDSRQPARMCLSVAN
jgi:2-methylcitrate dehydratase PrpD